ncbi:MAG: response regulator [bacterium]|nr:response regulator [bacterium]
MTDSPSAPLILVIDDDWINRQLMENVLKRAGFAVQTVPTGTEGLQFIQQTPPVIVIVDLRLPDIDGLDLIPLIRDLPLPRRIGIVVMSAMSTESVSRDSLAAGADLFISKVFTIPDLTARLHGLVEALNAD